MSNDAIPQPVVGRTLLSTPELIRRYTVEHLTMEQIAVMAGISKAAICQRLKKANVRAKSGTWVSFSCDFCGKPDKVTRGHYRKASKHYCTQDCYYASLENPDFNPWRHGQRLARALVSHHFSIPDNAIVHHVDGNDHNNDLSNLRVIDSQANHLKTHRTGKPCGVIWPPQA